MEAQGGYNTEDAHHQINMEKGKECQALPVKKPGLLDDEGCVREDLPNGFHREPEWDKARALEDAPIFMGTTCFPPRPDVRNIMITGGAGFIASWVTRHLTLTYKDAYDIVVYDKLDYAGSLNNLRRLQSLKNFHFFYGDICSRRDVESCVDRFQVDTILHFAAQSHVARSFEHASEFTTSNVLGTQVLLECAKNAHVRRFLYVSTDEVYGEPPENEQGECLECSESAPLRPNNPYSATKAAGEMFVRAYGNSFKLPVIIMRSNNAYGPNQYPEKIIPRFALRLFAGLRLPLQGGSRHGRRYLYASDLADAVDTILHRGRVGEVYNVASGDEVSNVQVCRLLMSHFNLSFEEDSAEWVSRTEDRPFNDRIYYTDGKKLEALGWTQKTRFEEGLRQTVEWYKQYGLRWWGDISEVLETVPSQPPAGTDVKALVNGFPSLSITNG